MIFLGYFLIDNPDQMWEIDYQIEQTFSPQGVENRICPVIVAGFSPPLAGSNAGAFFFVSGVKFLK